MVQADTEAHLTLEDQPLTRLADLAEMQAQQALEVRESEQTELLAKSTRETTPQKPGEPEQRIPGPTGQQDDSAMTDSGWNNLSAAEKEAELERIARRDP